MGTKMPNQSLLKLVFGHLLREDDAILVRRCLELITQYSGLNFSVVNRLDRNSPENGDESLPFRWPYISPDKHQYSQIPLTSRMPPTCYQLYKP